MDYSKIRKIEELQREAQKIQAQLKQSKIEYENDGIKIIINGQLEVVSIEILAHHAKDINNLRKLLIHVINQGMSKAQNYSQKRMQEILGAIEVNVTSQDTKPRVMSSRISSIVSIDSQLCKFEGLSEINCSNYLLPTNWEDILLKFQPLPEYLKLIHFELFKDSEFGDLAGKYRITPAVAGDSSFIDANQIPSAILELFMQYRDSPAEILAFSIDALNWVHPFVDGNRRSIWLFTNYWLLSKGFRPVKWQFIRPSWEKMVMSSPNERLSQLVKDYLSI